MLKAQAKVDRERDAVVENVDGDEWAESAAGVDVAVPVERKPSASVRVPPIPARASRDLAAARRAPSTGIHPSVITAPESGPTAMPGPIARQTRAGRKEPTPAPVAAAEPAPAPAPAAESIPAVGSTAAPEPVPAVESAPAAGSEDESEPELLEATKRAESDGWSDPAPEPVAKSQDGEEWAGADDSSDTFTTPPTRPQLAGAKSKLPTVDPVPEIPDAGLWAQVKYLTAFSKARWQRRGAIKTLREQITIDTGALDSVLGELGFKVRELKIENRGLSAENTAINEAEERKARADQEFGEQQNHQAEENNRFADIEKDRGSKVEEASAALDRAKEDLGSLEAQRRGLRSKRKEIQGRQEGLVKAAEDREGKAAKMEMGDERASLRRSAEELRSEAAGLDPNRQDIDRRLSALEKPTAIANSKVEALKAELESAKRSLNDAREGHRHKQSEIEAVKGKKSRELAQAEAEIKRRLVTLGTLVNLNRIDRDEFVETYGQIDTLRGAIGSRTNEIDRLTVERDAYDKQSLVRGGLILGGAIVLVILAVAILIWAI